MAVTINIFAVYRDQGNPYVVHKVVKKLMFGANLKCFAVPGGSGSNITLNYRMCLSH